MAITNFLRMFESLLIKSNGFDRSSVKPAQFVESINLYFAFAIIWSLGAPLDDDTRPIFAAFVKDHLLELCTFGDKSEDDGGGPDCRWPAGEDDVYGFVVNPEERVFEAWTTVMDQYTYDPEVPYFNILVPTIDTTRIRYVVQ